MRKIVSLGPAVAAVLAVASPNALAGITPKQPQTVLHFLPVLEIAASPRFTIGGKTAAWNTTITLAPQNTSTTQAHKFSGGYCVYDFSFDVKNVGTAAHTADHINLTEYAGFRVDNFDGPGSGGGGVPPLQAGQSASLKDWMYIKPGLHRLEAVVSLEGSKVPFASNTRYATVNVTGPCYPKGALAPPPLKINPLGPTKPTPPAPQPTL